MKLNEDLINEHQLIFSDFFDRLMSIKSFDLNTMNSSIAVERMMANQANNIKELQEAIKISEDNLENGTEIKSEDNLIQFFVENIKYYQDGDKTGVKSDDPFIQSLFTKMNKNRKRINTELEQHRGLILMNICSTFEIFISSLMKFELMNVYQNGAYITQNTISYKDIIELGSIEKVKENLVEKLISDYQYEKLEDWLEYVFKICTSLNISKKKRNEEVIKIWKKIESISVVFQKRNIFVHNNGIVNQIYLNNVKDSNLNIGDKVKLKNSEIVDIVDMILEFGADVFVLNMNKNKYFKDESYSTSLTEYLIGNVEQNPYICKKFFVEMLNLDMKSIKSGHIDDTLKIFTGVDCINTWLSYDLMGSKDRFLIDFQSQYNIIRDLATEQPSIKFLDALIRNESTEKLFEVFEEVMGTYKSKTEKVNALDFPIFYSLRNEEKFIEYAKGIRYND